MNNLRIVSDNAIDRATLTSSSSASALMSTSNLKSDRKSNVWRSVLGTTAWLAATWPSLEPISAVALPFCNLSPTATMRVRATNEPSTTNKLSSSSDFTQAAWVKTSVVVSGSTVSGPDGLLSAYTLTASASGGTIQQSVAVSAGNNVSSIFVRRRSGTGAVSIRNAANSSWTAIGVGSGWVRFSNDGGATGTTAYLSIQLATSGDSVDIAYGQVEPGSAATSYYPGTRPLGYIDGWQSYSYDNTVQCAPDPAIALRGWTVAQSASAYAYGGGTFARVWIQQISVYGLRIDIVDANNVQGYIEAARWVAGPYWATTYNPSAVTFGLVDTTDIKRTDGGDQVTDAGTVYRTLSINLSMMAQQDRAPFIALVRNSRVYPILVSVFPEQSDVGLERDTIMYGRRTKNTDVSIQYAYAYTSSVELESI